MAKSLHAILDEADQREARALAYCVKRRRLALGLTQADLAHQAGLSVSEIQHLEHGRRNPWGTTLKRVSRGLGIFKTELSLEVERIADEWERSGCVPALDSLFPKPPKKARP